MCRHSSYTDHKHHSDHKCRSGRSEQYSCEGLYEQREKSYCGKYSVYSGFPNFGNPGPVITPVRFANLIQNGGMEFADLIGTTPRSWTITGTGTRTGFTTLAYTGTYATFLNNAATLSQLVAGVTPAKEYELSFYAAYGLNQNGGLGQTIGGATIGLNANVYYVQMGTPILLATLPIVAGNLGATYGYYRLITPPVPSCATTLLVQFVATNGTLVPGAATDVGVLIDDVALVKA